MRTRLCLLTLLVACRADDLADKSDKADTGDTGGTDTGPDDSGDPDEVLDQVREAVERDLRENYSSGAQVCIWYQGEVLLNEGFGSAHPDQDLPVGSDTLFQIGSDTKKIAAITLLQQVDAANDESLTLGSPLSEVIPELAFASDADLADEITLHHLLSHTSTLFDYTPWDSAPTDAELEERALGEFAENAYIYGDPGAYWSYSNPNFSLAGLAAERLAQRPWPDLALDDVFSPLGMTRSFARLEDVAADGDYATGYGVLLEGYDAWDVFGDVDYTIGTLEMADQIDNGFIRPAGLVWSTARDMCTLGAFLIHGDEAVLSADSLKALTSAQTPLYPFSSSYGYGYGLMVNERYQLGDVQYAAPLWSHGGNTMTMTSAIYILPEQDFVLSILDNGYGSSFSTTAYVALSRIPEHPAAETPVAFEEDGFDLSAYAGTFEDPNLLGTVELTAEGDELLVSAPDLAAMGISVGARLNPLYRGYFTWRLNGQTVDLSFADGLDGTPNLYVHNRRFGLVRQDPAETAAPPPPPPHRTPAELGRLLDGAHARPLRVPVFLAPGANGG